MSRSALLSISFLLFCAFAFLMGLNGCGLSTSSNNSSTADSSPAKKIQHVVIIFQENRTPDNLFHDPVLIARGADIASSGVNSKGETIPLSEIGLGTNGNNPDNYDLSHAHSAFVEM